MDSLLEYLFDVLFDRQVMIKIFVLRLWRTILGNLGPQALIPKLLFLWY